MYLRISGVFLLLIIDLAFRVLFRVLGLSLGLFKS